MKEIKENKLKYNHCKSDSWTQKMNSNKPLTLRSHDTTDYYTDSLLIKLQDVCI